MIRSSTVFWMTIEKFFKNILTKPFREKQLKLGVLSLAVRPQQSQDGKGGKASIATLKLPPWIISRRNRMNDIGHNGANAINTQDRQAAITGGSFSVKIGKTRFIVRVMTTENNGKTLETALREACAQDILNEARRSNLEHLEKMRKIS